MYSGNRSIAAGMQTSVDAAIAATAAARSATRRGGSSRVETSGTALRASLQFSDPKLGANRLVMPNGIGGGDGTI